MPSDNAVSLWSKVHPSQHINDARLRCLASLFPVGAKVRSKSGGSLMTVTVGNRPNDKGLLGSVGGNRIHYAGSAYRGEYGTNYIATVDSKGYKNGYRATDLEIVNEGPDLTAVKAADQKFPVGTRVRVRSVMGNTSTLAIGGRHIGTVRKVVSADSKAYAKDNVGGCFISGRTVRVLTVPGDGSKPSDTLYFAASDLEPVREPLPLSHFGFGKQAAWDFGLGKTPAKSIEIKFQVLTDTEIERIKAAAKAEGFKEGRKIGRQEGHKVGERVGRKKGQADAERRVREALTDIDPSGWVGR